MCLKMLVAEAEWGHAVYEILQGGMKWSIECRCAKREGGECF